MTGYLGVGGVSGGLLIGGVVGQVGETIGRAVVVGSESIAMSKLMIMAGSCVFINFVCVCVSVCYLCYVLQL